MKHTGPVAVLEFNHSTVKRMSGWLYVRYCSQEHRNTEPLVTEQSSWLKFSIQLFQVKRILIGRVL